MTLGLFLSLMNHIHRKDTVSIINEFVPQFIFMEVRLRGVAGRDPARLRSLTPACCSPDRARPGAQAIFGYLVICIIYKWCTDWVALKLVAPSLLDMLINMFLSPGAISDPLYNGQVRRADHAADARRANAHLTQAGHGSFPAPLHGARQGPLQVFLLVIAIIAIPWMLLVKPLWNKYVKPRTAVRARPHGRRWGCRICHSSG